MDSARLKRRASRIAAAVLAGMMSLGGAFGKNSSQQSSSQQAANRHDKAGVWIMVFDPQGALVPGAEVRLIDSSGKQTYAKTSDSDALFFPRSPVETIYSLLKHRDF